MTQRGFRALAHLDFQRSGVRVSVFPERRHGRLDDDASLGRPSPLHDRTTGALVAASSPRHARPATIVAGTGGVVHAGRFRSASRCRRTGGPHATVISVHNLDFGDSIYVLDLRARRPRHSVIGTFPARE